MKKANRKEAYETLENVQRNATTFEAKSKADFFALIFSYVDENLKVEQDFSDILKGCWRKAEDHTSQLGALITSAEYAEIIKEVIITIFEPASFETIHIERSVNEFVFKYMQAINKTAYRAMYPNREAYELSKKL